MQNTVSKKSLHKKRQVVRKSSKQGPNRQGKETDIKPQDERVEILFEHIARIYPRDFEAIVKSFEEWASEWE